MKKENCCSRCKGHGKIALMKGHNQNCPYSGCTCVKCRVVVSRGGAIVNSSTCRRRNGKTRARTTEIENFRAIFDRYTARYMNLLNGNVNETRNMMDFALSTYLRNLQSNNISTTSVSSSSEDEDASERYSLSTLTDDEFEKADEIGSSSQEAETSQQ